MAGITLAQAQALLDAAIAAQLKALTANQAYEVNTGGSSRRVQRVDAAQLAADVEKYDRLVKQLSVQASGRCRSYSMVTR